MRNALEVVKAFYAAAAAGNGAQMAEQLESDVTWIEMEGTPYGGTYTGPEEVFSGVFARLVSEWDDFQFTPERFHDAQDSVAAAGWYTGKFRKTGKALRCRAVHLWEVSGGKVRRFEQFCDTFVMRRALI